MILMESAMKLRHRVVAQGESIRAVSKETGLSRNTVRKYVRNSDAPSYKQSDPRPRPKLQAFEARLREMFEADQHRPSRERRTAQKLYEQVSEEGYAGSYATVRRFVRELRGERSGLDGGFIPLAFQAGDAMQFDWSEEYVVLGGVRQKVHAAHFRLCHSRKPFVVVYPRESQEMVFDAFIRAFAFYRGIPCRVIIDNPKTMVTKVKKGKERDYHDRFLALLNHYVVEPVACTPASGWEKGQVEKQVQDVRGQLFTPILSFNDMDELNAWLLLRSEEQGSRSHPEQKDKSINDMYTQEHDLLRAVGLPFDGYAEKQVRARSTCLIQYDCNRYSVPARYAGKPVTIRAYAERVVVICNHEIIAEHRRCFEKNISLFEPWHYVPLLERKPGALRDGAPFVGWQLSDAMEKIKAHYLAGKGGDREFIDLLLLVPEHGIDAVQVACELAVEQGVLRLSAIINLINQLVEPTIDVAPDTQQYPKLETPPKADCKRYERLYSASVETQV